jgi:hypothetical protein
MADCHERPKVSWTSRRIGDLFTDTDGSVWQVQVDFDTQKVFPVKIQEAPLTTRLHTSKCCKPSIRQKF